MPSTTQKWSPKVQLDLTRAHRFSDRLKEIDLFFQKKDPVHATMKRSPRAERTVILVAHRLSTLRDVDRIFVLDSGRIVEVGGYAELSQRGGIFSELQCAGDGRYEAPRSVVSGICSNHDRPSC